MRNSRRLLPFLFLILIFCVFSVQLTFAKKATSEPIKEEELPPPEPTKKEELPAESAPKEELPLGLQTQEIPAIRVEEEYQQVWCLERQGLVNVVLSDKTICDCLTETHAVAFASEKNWTEALGKTLHHALTTERAPGIVVFVGKDPEQPHVFQLNAVIKYFKLPIVVWKIEIEPEEEKDEKGEEEEKEEKEE